MKSGISFLFRIKIDISKQCDKKGSIQLPFLINFVMNFNEPFLLWLPDSRDVTACRHLKNWSYLVPVLAK